MSDLPSREAVRSGEQWATGGKGPEDFATWMQTKALPVLIAYEDDELLTKDEAMRFAFDHADRAKATKTLASMVGPEAHPRRDLVADAVLAAALGVTDGWPAEGG